MFDPTSRYANVGDARYTTRDGQTIVYKKRRFASPAASMPLLTLATVAQSDRLDLIAYRTLGRPELSWRIADANDALDPFALVVPGQVLRVPRPLP
ncbi:MAG TPA: hypothetical protein VGS22_11040 [Thermoanaerobaculia bacterium]|nr:hypothetical protein [Thermoanaerobaculia bacterium]